MKDRDREVCVFVCPLCVSLYVCCVSCLLYVLCCVYVRICACACVIEISLHMYCLSVCWPSSLCSVFLCSCVLMRVFHHVSKSDTRPSYFN
jgi:hypothetical protein